MPGYSKLQLRMAVENVFVARVMKCYVKNNNSEISAKDTCLPQVDLMVSTLFLRIQNHGMYKQRNCSACSDWLSLMRSPRTKSHCQFSVLGKR
jgi:hypothetical protein